MFSSVSIFLSEIFEGMDNVEILIDEAVGFDTGKNLVKLKSGNEVRYDWLIVSAGSVTNFYDIPGLRARALEFKSTGGALNVRNAVDEAFERRAKHEQINIVVGGGGFTGVEIASELAGYVENLAKLHGHPRENVSVSIVEASPAILGSLGEWPRKKAEKRLKELGVKIILAEPITDVRDGSVLLKSGKTQDFDVLVWTAGVRANPICEKILGAKIVQGSCVVVDNHLRVGGYENVFAVGDISFCGGFGGKPMPMTSQTAVSQGAYVAYSIKRILHHRKVFKYHPRKSRFIMPLGGKYAVADLGLVRLSGFLPWYLKRFAALKYFLSILPLRKALRIWLYGARF